MPPSFSQKILQLKPDDSIAFISKYLLNQDLPGGSDFFSEGPYTVKEVFVHTYSVEYRIEYNKKVAFLEVEEVDDGLLILLQVHMDEEFPALFEEFQSIWKPDIEHFVLNRAEFQLTERGKSECNKEPYEYSDYYSKSKNSGQKLFVGIENYGTKEIPETDTLIGYTLPLDAINLIRSV